MFFRNLNPYLAQTGYGTSEPRQPVRVQSAGMETEMLGAMKTAFRGMAVSDTCGKSGSHKSVPS